MSRCRSAPPGGRSRAPGAASRAPKFWPAMGAAAKAMAMAGRKIDCITRMPMPKPAWAADPKSRISQ